MVDHPHQGRRLGAAGPQRRREQRRYCHTSVIVVDSVDPDALRRWRKPPTWGA